MSTKKNNVKNAVYLGLSERKYTGKQASVFD